MVNFQNLFVLKIRMLMKNISLSRLNISLNLESSSGGQLSFFYLITCLVKEDVFLNFCFLSVIFISVSFLYEVVSLISNLYSTFFNFFFIVLLLELCISYLGFVFSLSLSSHSCVFSLHIFILSNLFVTWI